MQVTNKRVIFRAAGASYTGKLVLHHEFAINEIAGIEVKKSTRLSGLNLIFGIILPLLIASPLQSLFSTLNHSSSVLAILLGYPLIVAFLAPFFLLKKKFWLKLCLVGGAIGVSMGLTDLSEKAVDYMFGKSLLEFSDTISVIIFFIWIFNIILVSLVPDLRFCVKTKGAAEAIQIRRKKGNGLFQPKEEYTGFSEVLPWTDTDLVTKELGTLIDDIQTSGDYAIEKWKEK